MNDKDNDNGTMDDLAEDLFGGRPDKPVVPPVGPLDIFERPDIASHMTLVELRTLLVFSTMLAYEQELSDDASILVGILVRDSGEPDKLDRAPWIEFSVGEKQYAFWRRTMDVYEVDEHGAVADDPLFYNDQLKPRHD